MEVERFLQHMCSCLCRTPLGHHLRKKFECFHNVVIISFKPRLICFHTSAPFKLAFNGGDDPRKSSYQRSQRMLKALTFLGIKITVLVQSSEQFTIKPIMLFLAMANLVKCISKFTIRSKSNVYCNEIPSTEVIWPLPQLWVYCKNAMQSGSTRKSFNELSTLTIQDHTYDKTVTLGSDSH